MNSQQIPQRQFEHQHAAHCESGVISNLLRHHGVQVSESLAFGLSAGLSFAYLPFIKISGQPLVAYRAPPRAIIKGLLAPLAARFRFETFGQPSDGQQRLDALLASGQVVGLQTSVYWLPYFPPDMRFHFNPNASSEYQIDDQLVHGLHHPSTSNLTTKTVLYLTCLMIH